MLENIRGIKWLFYDQNSVFILTLQYALHLNGTGIKEKNVKKGILEKESRHYAMFENF